MIFITISVLTSFRTHYKHSYAIARKKEEGANDYGTFTTEFSFNNSTIK